jgi:hypothetical protein
MDDTPGYKDERRQVLAALDVDRNQLLRNVQMSRVRDIENAYIGDWSVKEIVAPVAAWEREVVTALQEARAGKHPAIMEFEESTLDAWNAAKLAERGDFTLGEALNDLNASRQALIGEIELFLDEDVYKPESLVRYLLEAVSGHDREHWRELAAKIAGMAGARPETSVSLPPVRQGRG